LLTIPKEAEEIISRLESYGFEAYLVGGCVRDLLMGINAKDFDICTSALPEDVLRLFTKTLKTGLKHGTVTVIKKRYSV
jgi:tRNA nucleotidyltransferase (CCA-adding enzyme)